MERAQLLALATASSSAGKAVEFGRSVTGRIEAALAERIVSGALLPGTRLRQDHIEEEFEASHVPVREAFRTLEAQGLVIGKPRCGVRVSEIDPGMVFEVTEMRAALEVLALHHARPRLGKADLDAAHRALVEGEASDQIAVWEAANRRFHVAITARRHRCARDRYSPREVRRRNAKPHENPSFAAPGLSLPPTTKIRTAHARTTTAIIRGDG
jgi:DNA-binding GntR family transcriptional regulator